MRRIDAIPGVVVDERELLAPRADAASGRRAGWQAEMVEDAAHDALVVDERDQAG